MSDVVDPVQENEPAAAAPAVLARPDGCVAAKADDLVVCPRCGLEWLAGKAGPPCEPITFARLRRRMLSEATAAEVSLAVVHRLRRAGTPADPTRARRRLVELEAVMRLVERATTDPRIKAILNEKAGGK